MDRLSELERTYLLEAFENAFETSKNNMFNQKLEEQFAKTFNQSFGIGHANGTASMHSALLALGVGRGDEVIVPSITMASPALTVLQAGADPVFADVDRDQFTIDPAAVKALITEKTKAVIAVSIYGLACDYDALLAILDPLGIPLIEDNAQCFLGTYKGKRVGEFGTFASYSFQASKHMTCGSGGMLITRDADLADRARQAAVLGYPVGGKSSKLKMTDVQDPRYQRHEVLGWNYRMSELQAAVALGQLERLEELVAVRVRSAERFIEAVAGLGVFKTQQVPDHMTHTYWCCPLLLESDAPARDWFTFRDMFRANGGDGYYAGWLPNYLEPLFQNGLDPSHHRQRFAPGLCQTAEWLQPRLKQFKTNYWDEERGKRQAEILHQTTQEFAKAGAR